MEDQYVGLIMLFAGNFAPKNFMFCQGQTLAISGNQALFSLIGNWYGGDGRTTFMLPDLRGAVPVGVGQSKGGAQYDLGIYGGTEYTQLTTNELPTHTHTATFTPTGGSGGTPPTATVTVNAGTGGTVTNDPTNAYWGQSPSTGAAQSQDYTNLKNVQMASDAVQVTLSGGGGGGITGGAVTNTNTGSGLPFSKMPPYLPINYIICVEGLYPSRS